MSIKILKKILILFLFYFTFEISNAEENLKELGKFKDWKSFVLMQGESKVCFAQSTPVVRAPKKFGLNFAQMAIKFCEIQKFLTSVIIGATVMEQLKIDIESVNVNLTEEINKKINDVQIMYPNPCP